MKSAAARVRDARGDPPPPDVLAEAAAALRAGLVVGLPTDTVYGLAVDATRSGAADRVFAAKRRPRGVILPVLVADRSQAEALVDRIPEGARRLMATYWPGALTVVLARRPGIELDLGDDLDLGDGGATIGLRCPDHAVARALCALAGPLATTSANIHGEPPAHEAGQVAAMAGVALVLDAGRCDGQPSTVVDFSGAEPRVLRAGAVDWAP